MRLTILGGGGFRVPLVHRALLAGRERTGITELVLHDVDAGRLDAIGRVLTAQARGVPGAPRLITTVLIAARSSSPATIGRSENTPMLPVSVPGCATIAFAGAAM